MVAEKVIEGKIQWKHGLYTETAKAVLIVIVPERPSFSARLYLTAHVSRLPEKYGFSMLLGSERVAGLDVNPGRGHANFKLGKRETVWDTHWQMWPDKEAVVDNRTLLHSQWFRAFCQRCRIISRIEYKPPPHFGGEQPSLF